MNVADQRILIITCVGLLISTWGFVGDLYLVSQVLIVLSLYYFIVVALHLRFSNEVFRELMFLNGLIATFIAFVIISFFNGSFQFNSISNSFQDIPHLEWIPSSATSDVTISKLPFVVFLLGCVIPVSFLYSNKESFGKLRSFVVLNGLCLASAGLFVDLLGGDKMLGLIVPPSGTERYFFSTFTYKNHCAIFFILCLCCAAGSFKCNHVLSNSKLKLCIGLGMVLFPVCVVLTGSRSCIVVCYILLVCFFVNRFKDISIIYRLGVAVFVPSSLVAIALMFNLENYREIVNTTRLYYLNYTETQSTTRLLLTRDTWNMFLDSYVFGWGLGSFEVVFNYYDGGYYKGEGHGKGHYYIYAHNDVLQVLSEVGIIGLLLFGSLLCYPCIVFSRYKVRDGWVTTGLLIVLLYSFIEFPFRTPAVAYLFCVLFAYSFTDKYKT